MIARSWSSGLREVFLALAIATVMAACGGGGYMGSSNMPNPAPPVAATVKLAVGAITGFGSAQVSVNGLKFVTTGAAITVDGKAGSQADLHAGDVVQIKAHHDAASDQDIADDIDFRGNVEGPVTAIDPVAQTLTVLGQTVQVTADTSFDDAIVPASLAGLQVGDVVEVSGMAAADGAIQATRIERHSAASATDFRVTGVASATDATAKTLKINALLVDFSTAMLTDFPAAGPADGDLIEAHGTVGADGTLVATRLELRNADNQRPQPEDQAEVDGLITRFASVTDFDVSGKPVSTSASTTFEGGAASDLALSVRVEVEGTVDANGVIAASRVRIGHPSDVRISAQVDAVDASGGTVTVLGIQVTVDALTRLEDHGSGKSQMFGLADIHSGDWLEIRARSASGGNPVTALRVDRREPQSEVRLSGEVATAAQPDFTILSANIATTAATQFANGLDGTTFFTDPVGKVVSVRGTWDGAVLSASQVQLGDTDNGDDN